MAQWDVTTTGAMFEFDTTEVNYNQALAIDTNHFLVQYSGTGSDGYVAVLAINTSTWAITTTSVLEYDTTNGLFSDMLRIDTNHFLCYWSGAGADGFAQTMVVNTTTWAVTTAVAPTEWDTVQCQYNDSVWVDANHLAHVASNSGGDGFIAIHDVNTTTYAFNVTGSPLEFDTQDNTSNSIVKVDTNHVVNFWHGGTGSVLAQVQAFTVNTTTWAITTAASVLSYDTDLPASSASHYPASMVVDANHILHTWHDAAGSRLAQIFEVNTTTWAVTTAGSILTITTAASQANAINYKNSIARIDTNHFLHAARGWNGSADAGLLHVLVVDTSTWAVTTTGSSLDYTTTIGQGVYPTIAPITGYDSYYLLLFRGTDNDGYSLVVSVETASVANGFIPRIIIMS